ncbi:MAG: hypothetical protein IT247_09230 [Bacteroidia bacterium]|nr:hypothetical protein [Bacteroidia bacterium]
MATNKQIDHLLEDKPNPIKKIIISVVVVALFASNIVLFQKLQSKTEEMEQTTRNIEMVKHEKDSLTGEVDRLEAELISLQQENSELDSLVDVKDEELRTKIVYIRQLIARGGSGDSGSFTKAKAEISKLKEERDNYLAQMEELKAKNTELSTKNAELGSSLTDATLKAESATKEKGILAEKVKLGSQMMAANLKVDAVSIKGSKEKVTTKSKSAQKFRICFTILQNLIVDKGPRNIYVRVLGPDKSVMASNVSNTFIYRDKATVYSEKKQYQYDNKSIDMCVYWDRTQDQLQKGDYTVELYDDLSLMTKSTVVLK